jgi:phosphate transport system permease protein
MANGASTALSTARPLSRRARRADHLGELLFTNATLIATLLVLLLLGGVVVALTQGALPALRQFGPAFVTSADWNPVTDQFGAEVAIFGTMVTALIALLIGIPLSIGIAFFLTEICPKRFRRAISTAIELLAAVPSIIYGIWGLFVLAPFLQVHVQPRLITSLGSLPGIGALFAGPPLGIGVLTAGLILGLMVLPFIASTLCDVFRSVPVDFKESAYGLGCTTFEVIWHVVLPFGRTGVVGGIMLGLGRALGETMAVTFVIGNSHRITPSLLAPGSTIASTIANEFTEAVGPLYTAALLELGLILFVISFVVLVLAKTLLGRVERIQGGLR